MSEAFEDYEIVSWITVDYGDLETFINKHYGLRERDMEFSIPCDQECSSGKSIDLSVKRSP